MEKYAGDHFTSTVESNFHLDTVSGSGRHLKAPSSSSSLTGCLALDIAAGNYRADLTKLHTWRVEWISGVSIAVYLDGQLRAKTTDTTYVPHTIPHRLTLQHEFYGVSDSSVCRGLVGTHESLRSPRLRVSAMSNFSPDGYYIGPTSLVMQVLENTGYKGISQNVAVAASQQYTVSIWVSSRP